MHRQIALVTPLLFIALVLSPAQPVTAQQVHARVTLNGLRVNHETVDHMFEADGKRDEVYVVSNAVVFRNGGTIVSRYSRQTQVMGDVNGQEGRIQAGGASSSGGLRTGDLFPSDEPWRGGGPVSGGGIPMRLWEGVLIRGARAVVIIPTIWEWDGPDEVVLDYRNRVFDTLPGVLPALNLRETDMSHLIRRISGGPGVERGFRLTPFGSAADRPIGVDGRGVLDEGYTFQPIRIFLTAELAAQAAADTSSGLGPGIFRIEYQDSPGFDGHYTLFIQVEIVSSR